MCAHERGVDDEQQPSSGGAQVADSGIFELAVRSPVDVAAVVDDEHAVIDIMFIAQFRMVLRDVRARPGQEQRAILDQARGLRLVAEKPRKIPMADAEERASHSIRVAREFEARCSGRLRAWSKQPLMTSSTRNRVLAAEGIHDLSPPVCCPSQGPRMYNRQIPFVFGRSIWPECRMIAFELSFSRRLPNTIKLELASPPHTRDAV